MALFYDQDTNRVGELLSPFLVANPDERLPVERLKVAVANVFQVYLKLFTTEFVCLQKDGKQSCDTTKFSCVNCSRR